jgi:hypothetical protein
MAAKQLLFDEDALPAVQGDFLKSVLIGDAGHERRNMVAHTQRMFLKIHMEKQVRV